MDSGVGAAVAVGADFGVSVVAGRVAAVGSSVAAGVTAATGWADACAVVLAVGCGEERPAATLGDACSRGELATAPSQAASKTTAATAKAISRSNVRSAVQSSWRNIRQGKHWAGQAASSAIALRLPLLEVWRVGQQLHGLSCDRRPRNSSENQHSTMSDRAVSGAESRPRVDCPGGSTPPDGRAGPVLRELVP